MGVEQDPGKRDLKAARLIACHGAIRAGQKLDAGEQSEMIKQLAGTAQPRTCPHGRPTMLHLSSQQLKREFGRTQ
jgi:DNA mismatch repair protein MutL